MNLNLSKLGKKLLATSSLIVALLGVIVIPAANAVAPCTSSTWIKGDTGNCVSYIQELLDEEIPKQVDISPNAQFGTNTYNGVVTYQKDVGITGGNGQVGYHTWKALCSGYIVAVSYPNAKKDAGC